MKYSKQNVRMKILSILRRHISIYHKKVLRLSVYQKVIRYPVYQKAIGRILRTQRFLQDFMRISVGWLSRFFSNIRRNYRNVLGNIPGPVASVCIVSALIILLAMLFRNIQPWFSIAVGALLFLFGSYSLWYAYRMCRPSALPFKEAWSNYEFRFSIKAGGGSFASAITAFLSAAYPGLNVFWTPITLFVISLGLLCLCTFRWRFFIRELWRSLKSAEDVGEEEFQTEESTLSKATHIGQVMGGCAVGLLYVAIFIPLALWSTETHDLNFANVLLFSDLGENVSGNHADILNTKNMVFRQFHLILDFSDPSHLFAFGVFYGTVNLVTVFMFVFLLKEGHWELILMSNGLLGGYILTIWIKHLLGAPLSRRILFVSGFNLGYVFLLYYGLRTLLDVVARWGIRKKYEFLLDGIQNIGTAWILSRIFDGGSIIFTGLTFFICTFVAVSVFEATIGRLLKPLYGLVPRREWEETMLEVRTMFSEHHAQLRNSFCTTAVICTLFPLLVLGVLKLTLMAI